MSPNAITDYKQREEIICQSDAFFIFSVQTAFLRFAYVSPLLIESLSSYLRFSSNPVVYERSAQASAAREAMAGDSEEQLPTTRLLPKCAELPLECPTEAVRF